MNWQDFLAMDGYAVYVWPVYGLALIVLAANLIVAHRRERQLLRSIDRKARAEAGR